MLTKTEKSFSIIFLFIVIAEIICSSYSSLRTFHYITKPAIVISLILFFWNHSKHLDKQTRYLTLSALACSLLGDILLMFVSKSMLYFITGLIAFLIAHIMYILVFLKQRNKSKKAIYFVGSLVIYALVLFEFLKEGLGEFLEPVIVYMLVILSMATTAFLRKKYGNTLSYFLVFVGAILFLISDSILAVDKFYNALPSSNLSIMLTYSLAQICIVLGIKKQQ